MHVDFGLLLLILFVAITLIQIFYYLFYYLRLVIYPIKNATPTQANAPVSVIICAKNEERNIEANIDSWMTQQYHDDNGEPLFEVLLVDDNSDDGSIYVYNHLREQYPSLRILMLRQEAKGIKGKKFPLSMGIKEAKYETLILTDADCKPNSQLWLTQMVNAYKNESTQIVLGYSPYAKQGGFLNKWIRWETAYTAIQYLSYALAGNAYMGVGRNLSYKRKLFLHNKGFSAFSQLLSGDDDLFINQVATTKNTAICIHPQAYTKSAGKETFEAWWHQKSRHVSTSIYYKLTHKILLGVNSASHTLWWLLLIPALLLAPYWYIVLMGFGTRMLLQWLVLGLACNKLHERDIIPFIPLFDILTVYYNFRLFPKIFKSQTAWK
jgi:glycosyltransferase involved in cell wall biosynthesis